MKPRALPTVWVTILAGCFVVARTTAQITLSPVAQVNNGGIASAVAVYGHYVFLGAGSTGVWVYDVSSPANPVNVAHKSDGGNAFGLEVSSNLLFLANDYDGLRIYDISNPEDPVNMGHATNIPICHVTSVVLGGQYAYQADSACGLRICDVSATSNPIVVCPSTPVSGGQAYGPFGVAVQGRYAYAACLLDGLRVYDVGDPSQPVSVGHAVNSGQARGVAVAGSYAYLANGMDGLRIYDVSDSSNPTNIGHAPVDVQYSQDWSVRLSGTYALVSNDTDGVHIYDVSDPAHPVETASVNPGFVRDMIISGSILYAANDSSGLRIYSIGAANAPQLGVILTGKNTVVLSWPASPANFVMQTASNLALADWAYLTNTPTVVAGHYQLTLPTSTGASFYRLKPAP